MANTLNIQQHKLKGLLRKRLTVEERGDSTLSIQGKSVINFTSNDYLNLANHSDIKNAFIEGVQLYGVGSGASNFISGYFKSHQQLEEAFCEFVQRDRAIFFNSGYHANLGVLTALANRTNVIIADKLCHASIIDGILLSKAKYYRYHHNDAAHAEILAKQHNKPLLITESIFSMQGNITDVKKLAAITATLIVDDAHGVGVLGEHGRGICEHQNITQKDAPCLVTPLGKAFGSAGAIVSGDSDTMEIILQFARTYCFTTALPPAVSHATLTSLKIVQDETWRREKLKHLIDYFNKSAKALGFKLVSEDATPIRSILVNSNHKVLEIQQKLLDKGFFVSCIRPPTVPQNTSRLRISLSCAHTETDISQLLDALEKLL